MKTFYSVFWNGVLFRYDLAKEDERGKWYYTTNLLQPNEDDEWILVKDKPTSTFGMCNLSDGYIAEQIENGDFLINIEDAILLSKKLWDVHSAPNSM